MESERKRNVPSLSVLLFVPILLSLLCAGNNVYVLLTSLSVREGYERLAGLFAVFVVVYVVLLCLLFLLAVLGLLPDSLHAKRLLSLASLFVFTAALPILAVLEILGFLAVGFVPANATVLVFHVLFLFLALLFHVLFLERAYRAALQGSAKLVPCLEEARKEMEEGKSGVAERKKALAEKIKRLEAEGKLSKEQAESLLEELGSDER